jgi:hypothetical protein
MDAVAQIVVWLNVVANALGRVLLAPVAILPGWLSATLVAAATGVLLLVAFKYTSNQRAIKRVRDDIKANLLALKLFKESPAVTLRAQGRVFRGAFLLMVYAIVPMLVMAVPVCLMLSQIALWYQARPLQVGEEALISLKLNGAGATMPEVALKNSDALETLIGPLRVPSEREVYWSVRAKQPGRHGIGFEVGDATFEKELVVGDGFERTSLMRPGWNWSDIMLHPEEAPFAADSAVQSIAIAYPGRVSWTSGADTWVAYWFVVSMIAAFVGKPWLNVNI